MLFAVTGTVRGQLVVVCSISWHHRTLMAVTLVVTVFVSVVVTNTDELAAAAAAAAGLCAERFIPDVCVWLVIKRCRGWKRLHNSLRCCFRCEYIRTHATDIFSDRCIGRVMESVGCCVFACVWWTVSLHQNVLWRRYLARWFISTLSNSRS